MQRQFKEVPLNELRGFVDPGSLPFEDTASLEPPEEPILGQLRATDAIKFGMGMKTPGYHIFIAGPSKAGLTYAAKTYLKEQARKELKKDMEELIDTIEKKISKVFESDDYTSKEAEVHKAFEAYRGEILEKLSREAKEQGFILQVSQVGMVIIPATREGLPMSQEKLSELSDEEREKLKEKSVTLQERMKEAVKKIREAEASYKEERHKLDGQVALFVVGQIMEPCLDKYKDEPDVIESNPTYPNLFGSIERQAWFGALFTDFSMIRPGALHRANGGYLIMRALDLLKLWLSWEALKRALRDRQVRIEDFGELYGLFSTRTIRPEPIPLNIKIVLTGDPYLFELLHLYDDRFGKLFKVKAHMQDRMDRKEETALQCARMAGDMCRKKGLRHLLF